MRRFPQTALVLATMMLLASTLASCDEPSVDDRITAFLTAWQKAEFAGVDMLTPEGRPLDAAAAKQTLAGIEGELAVRRPRLTRHGKASVNHADALARIGVAWPLPDGRTWTYDTTVTARKLDNDWRIYFGTRTVHPDLQSGERLALRQSPAPRGTVLAADGTPIVSDVPVVYVGLEPQYVEDVAALVQRLDIVFRSVRVDVDVSSLPAKLKAAKPDAFVEVVTLRQSDFAEIQTDLADTRGVTTKTGKLSLPLTRTFARALLGTSGPVTKELIDGSGGALKAGDVTGLTGLQRRYDTLLRGLPGLSVVPMTVPAGASKGSPGATGSAGAGPGAGPSGGNSGGSSPGGSSSGGSSPGGSSGSPAVSTSPSAAPGNAASAAPGNAASAGAGKAGKPLATFDPVPGGQLKTTLDVKVQQAAEAALAATAKQSALVAVRVSDGAVLAVANGPGPAGYDLALLGEVQSPAWPVDAASVGVGKEWRLGADAFAGRVTQAGVVASPIGYAGAAAALSRGRWKQPVLVLAPSPGDPASEGPSVTGALNVPGVSVGVRGDVAYCVYVDGAGTDVTGPVADAFAAAVAK